MKSLKTFLHTTKDIFRIYWEIAPFLTLGVLITQILLSFQGLVNAYIFGLFIDNILKIISGSKDLKTIIPLIIAYCLINLALDVIGVLNNYFSSILSSMDAASLRLKQTDLMISFGISQMENPELTNKSTRFNEVYQSMFQHLTLLIGLITLIISTIVYGVVVYQFAPIVVFAVTGFFIAKYLNNGRFINRAWRLQLEYTEERRNAWTSAGYLSDPASLKEIILSNGVSLLRNKFFNFTNWNKTAYQEIRTRWAIYEVFHSFIDVVIFGFGFFFLIQKAIDGAATIGAFTFYLRSLGSFADQFNSLSYRIARTVESSIRLQDALELFEIYKPEEDGEYTLNRSKLPPAINIKNVSFTYPNGKHPVIKNLSIQIKPGEKIAIVGENGAGKTTLVKLLTRIYRANTGEISYDDINLNNIKKKSLYEKLGVLFQDFNTYGNLTVSENIQIGKFSKKFDIEKVKMALIKADALNFVNKYPKGLDQVLSERYKGGIRPSGGQWQKIAIARFFYRNAPVLILDEPTASIDAVSEAKIFDNVYKFMKGKTVIIISHRFSTVRNADRILVLDKGKIIEDGSHQELLALNGKYAHAFKLQAKGYE
jgi:ATP-binding cassette subfamily B protein